MSDVSFFVTLLVGIILGWLLSGLFEKQQTENQGGKYEAERQALATELTGCRDRLANTENNFNARIGSLENELQTQRAEVATRTAELTALQAQMQEQQLEYEQRLRAANTDSNTSKSADDATSRTSTVTLNASTAEQIAQAHADDFTKIRGIGPAFAARLATAGITTYAELAAVEPQELRSAVGIREWQKADPAAWVAEAATLANRPQRVVIGDELTRLEGIGPTYAIRLRAAGITTFRQLADADADTLSEIIAAPAWRRIAYDDWIAQAGLAADGDEAGLNTLQDRLFKRERDNLALIAGIGEASRSALHDAGITSYAALAQSTPDQVRTILKEAGVRSGNADAWIAEAGQRAAGKRIQRERTRTRTIGATQDRSCPQDLEAVEGIGPIYEQRLYAHGVGTYWELGMIADDELTTLLEIQPFQEVDLGAIKAMAIQLAQETETMGHIWDGTEPEDFEGLEGIGPVFERRLYNAGICSYAALAATTAEQIATICRAPSFNRPNFDRWIEQARELAGNNVDQA